MVIGNENTKRPPFLTALCGLTFVGSSVAFITWFLAALFFEKAGELIIKYSSWHAVEQITPLYFLILMVLNCFSLVGAIRMWKFRRDGFFVYAFAQLSIMFFPSIWLGWTAFSATNAIFTGVFLIGYSLNLKFLKR